MKIFNRNDKEVVDNALKMSLIEFTDKYQSLTSPEKLKTAYHEIRSKTSVKTKNPEKMEATSEAEPKPKVEKVKKEKAPKAEKAPKEPKVKKEKPAKEPKGPTKADAIRDLIQAGKTNGEIMKHFKEGGVSIYYSEVVGVRQRLAKAGEQTDPADTVPAKEEVAETAA